MALMVVFEPGALPQVDDGGPVSEGEQKWDDFGINFTGFKPSPQ